MVLDIQHGLGVDHHIERAEKIEPTTNIVAEHLAIQLALELAKEYGVTDLVILNDSQTPVNHVNGTYRVREPHLKPIVEKTWEMGQEFSSVEIRWVPREETKVADALCRKVNPKQSSSSPRSRPGGLAPQPPSRKNPFVR